MRVQFTVPGRPAPMQRVVPLKGGKPFTARESREAMRKVRKQALLAMGGRPPLTGPLKITVEAVFRRPPSWPDSHAEAKWHTLPPDAKNLLWLVEDSLGPQKVRGGVIEPGVIDNDAQFAVTISFKRYGSPERTIVTIEQLPELGSYKAPKPKAKRAQARLDLEVAGRPIIGGTR